MIAPTSLVTANLLLRPQEPVNRQTTPAEATASFADFLKRSLDQVAAAEAQVHHLNDLFIIGEADVNEVMIAAAKAELGITLTAQVHNKVIEAYQEIMRMQI